MGLQTSAWWGMRQNHSPDGATAAAFFVGVFFRVSIRKRTYNYSNQCNIIQFEADWDKYLLLYVLVIWIRKLLTKHRISYLTGTYLNFQLEEFLALFCLMRVCQRSLSILVKSILMLYDLLDNGHWVERIIVSDSWIICLGYTVTGMDGASLNSGSYLLSLTEWLAMGWSQSPCSSNKIFCNCARKLLNWLIRWFVRSRSHFIVVWKNLFRWSGKSGKLMEFFFSKICKYPVGKTSVHLEKESMHVRLGCG